MQKLKLKYIFICIKYVLFITFTFSLANTAIYTKFINKVHSDMDEQLIDIKNKIKNSNDIKIGGRVLNDKGIKISIIIVSIIVIFLIILFTIPYSILFIVYLGLGVLILNLFNSLIITIYLFIKLFKKIIIVNKNHKYRDGYKELDEYSPMISSIYYKIYHEKMGNQ